MRVQFARPHLTGDEGQAVADVIATGWVSQGPKRAEFEEAFARRVGAADAIATTSCTTALHARAPRRPGVGPGDEVIVPSLSFIATANSVWHCGATPVFADIDPLTYNLDPDCAERAITPKHAGDHARPPGGLPADMDRLPRARAALYGRRRSSRTRRARSAPATRERRSARSARSRASRCIPAR
jgi:perosamine synthetase